MELGGVAMFELTKPQYPKKQTINLAVQEVKGISKEWQIAIFCVFILLLILFTKFAVIGRIEQAEKVRNEYIQTAETIRDLNERLKDYNNVQQIYRQYDTSFFSESEKSEVDRLEIIEMIEECVNSEAYTREIRIASNQVALYLEETKLSYVSEIVARLQSDERASYVTVSTAGTGNIQDENQMVSADIMIQLKAGGEEDE